MAYIGQQPVVGRYILLDQISGGFNGTTSGFTMSTAGGVQGVKPGLAQNVLLSLGGVIQQPGVDYTISGSGITFTTPPVSGTTFFATVLGDAQSVGTPSDGTVTPASIAAGYDFAFPNVNVTGVTTIASGVAATPSLSITGDADTGIFSPAANTIAVTTSGDERFRVDSGGRLLVGTDSNRSSSALQVEGTTFATSRLSLTQNSATANAGATLKLSKSKGTSNGSFTAVSSGDRLGNVQFSGADGSGDITAATIEAFVDNTPGTNDMPGRLVFSTTADGAASTTERMRIDSSGRLLHGTSASVTANSEIRNVQIVTDVNNANQGLGIYAFTASNNAPRLDLGSSPNGSINTFTTASSTGGLCGRINFLGSDGDEFLPTARIEGRVDGTAGNGDMPGRLEFYTTADSASSPTERMRVDSSGRLGVGLTPSSTASITDVAAGLIQTDGNIDIRYAGSNSDPAGTRYVSFVNTDSTLVADQPMGGIRWVGNDTSNTSRDTASILAFCQNNSGTSSNITFNNNGGTERMRIDSSGRLLVGTASSRVVGSARIVQIEGTSDATAGVSLVRNSNDSNSPTINIGKSRGTSVGSNTVVQDDDGLGSIYFRGADGTDLTTIGAAIEAAVDGTPGSNDLPGRLVFSTTADGASSTTERMRIGNDGNCSIGTTTNTNKLRVHNGSDSANIILATGADESSEFISLGINSGVPTLTAGGVSSTSAQLAFRTADNGTEYEAARFDKDGRLLVGATSALLSSAEKKLQMTHANAGAGIVLGRNDTTVTAGNTIGMIDFVGNDSNGTYQQCAKIEAIADGTHQNDDKSTRLVFSTTEGGSSSSTERMRIDNFGRVGIGATPHDFDGNGDNLVISSSTHTGLTIDATSSTNSSIHFADGPTGNEAYRGYIVYSHSDDTMKIATSATEAMRINSSGNLLIAKTSTSFSSQGAQFANDGSVDLVRNGNPILYINREESDGGLVNFYQAANLEGSISVSGSTVSYNGGHLTRWSQLADGAARTEILRGSVLSNLDEMCEWGEEDNEQLNRMKVSDVEGDVNVSGVFQAWDDDDDTYTNDFYCAMTGDFVIRIAQGTTVARGDLLMSAGDGTAKPQDDDIVRSKTIAKVTSTTVSTTYADGSYCVPCVLMAC